MRSWILTALLAGLAAGPAGGAGYSKDEKTSAYELSLKVPDAPSAIPALKAEILRRFQAGSKMVKDEAAEDKRDSPETFHPYLLDAEWRVTFESPRVLSLSCLSVTDNGGAHPTNDYDTIVWDKAAGRSVTLPELFVKASLPAALCDIAGHAAMSFRKRFPHEEGQPADYDPVDGNIAADPAKLGHYALTYAQGDTKANGIVLLWGAGAPWPNVIGDIKLSIPVAVFRQYLAPQWAAEFK